MMDSANVYKDSVRPIIDSGLAVFVDTDAELAPGIRRLGPRRVRQCVDRVERRERRDHR